MAQLPARSGVSQTSGSDTTCAAMRRFGTPYVSDIIAALPGVGIARRVSIN
jgi:hypothetical protein